MRQGMSAWWWGQKLMCKMWKNVSRHSSWGAQTIIHSCLCSCWYDGYWKVLAPESPAYFTASMHSQFVIMSYPFIKGKWLTFRYRPKNNLPDLGKVVGQSDATHNQLKKITDTKSFLMLYGWENHTTVSDTLITYSSSELKFRCYCVTKWPIKRNSKYC